MLSLVRRLFNFLVYSNLFIAGCAVLMVYQTTTLLLGSRPDSIFLLFVFFATITSYSFHWFLTPDLEIDSSRLRWLKRNRGVHTILFIIGVAGAIWAGILLIKPAIGVGRSHWPWLVLAAIATFLYSAPKIPHPWFRALRRVALGKTIFLAFVWMYVTTALPLQLSDRDWQTDFSFFSISRFFLIYAICIVFDYRDREYDRSIGIRSLITWLNDRGITILFIISLLVFGLFTILLVNFGQDYLTIILLLIPGIILAFLYKNALSNFSDITYYFILDGLMALSSVLLLIERFI